MECLPVRYLPTPAEIAAACLEIQSHWSAEERYYRRCCLKHGERTGVEPSEEDAWQPPLVHVTEIARAAVL
jgi:hypothetical protein